MINPYRNRTPSLNDPARDIQPVTPNDSADLSNVAVALYIETGGAIRFVSAMGHERTINVTDFTILPVGSTKVFATGTNASGIHALTVS